MFFWMLQPIIVKEIPEVAVVKIWHQFDGNVVDAEQDFTEFSKAANTDLHLLIWIQVP